jgi:DegV family protein with EDD domain
VGDFQEVYERLLKEVDSIVSIHIGAKLSPGTVQAAQTARQSLAKPERVELVDSQATSLATGFAIMEAVEASRAGAKLAEVKAAAESAVRRTHVLFMVDTLEYLRRGGRIGRARAYLGALLSIKPILTLREGEVYPEERVRTRARGLERIIQAGIRHQNVKLAAVGHSSTPDEAESIRDRVAMAFPNVKVHLIRFGPVIGTHGGPGLVGVGVMEGE